MESHLTASASNETAPGPVRVTVRYWAAARAAAGRAEDQVDAATVAEALDRVRRTHVDNPRFASVLAVSSLLVGDRPIGTRDPETVPVVDGDVIEVLPPFAGG
jgi:sulfur-carrier protein